MNYILNLDIVMRQFRVYKDFPLSTELSAIQKFALSVSTTVLKVLNIWSSQTQAIHASLMPKGNEMSGQCMTQAQHINISFKIIIIIVVLIPSQM